MKKIIFIMVAAVLLLSGCSVSGAKSAPDNIISQQEAQNIVFEKAGVTENEVTMLETKFDYDEDRKSWEYDIEFNVNDTEYDSEVDAQSGEIIKYENDR